MIKPNKDNYIRRRFEISESREGWYHTSARCQNCYNDNTAYVKKGVPLKGLEIECDRCGCDVPL